MAYSPYNALLRVYNAKKAWNNATTDEERQKQHEIANTARKELEQYNYGYLADQVSADTANAEATQKVLDAWAPKVDTTTGNYKTGVDNEAYNQTIGSASRKSDTAFNTIQSDHTNVNSKYDDVFNYANSDITQTDEYKSAFANIMPSYNLAAMQGRDNEVATGGANNGGNIDSFAAANATRQQAAITAKGQALAHQMGMDAVNSRVANARSILSDLGVYNSSVYSAMDQNINTDRALANDIFANAQTSINDQFEREQIAEQNAINNGIKLSEMYGYLAPELLYRSPMYSRYFNTDGTLKDENIDYKAAIAEAEKSGDKSLAEALRVARGTKIFGDYAKWGQYDDGDYSSLPIVQTRPAQEFDSQIEASKYAVDAATEQTKLTTKAQSDDNDKQRQHELELLRRQQEFAEKNPELTDADKDILKLDADSRVSNWLYTPYGDWEQQTVYKNQDPNVHGVYYAAQKINDPDTLQMIKLELADNGWSAAEITKKIAEYRDNIAKSILRAEGVSTTDPDYETKLKATKDAHNLN